MPFRDLVGHRHLVELIARAVARGTLPPSLILAGPDGVGKLTIACAVAEVVNCLDPVRPVPGLFVGEGEPGPVQDARDGPAALEIDACGACRSCRRLRRGVDAARRGEDAALDCLRIVQPDERGSIKIDRVREVIAAAAYRPFDGRRRVVIVEGAEALETGAQNALLKVLEEPPSGTVFVLVTAQPDSLLATIRSRCPRLRFGPLATGDVVEALVRHGGHPPAQARVAAALADGSVGRALRHLAGDLTDARDAAVDMLRTAAGAGDDVHRRLAAAQELLAKGQGRARGKRGAPTRLDVAERLEAMASLVRDLGVVVTRADARRLANADLAPDLARLAKAFDDRRVGRAFDAVGRAAFALERNVGHKTVADWLALQL